MADHFKQLLEFDRFYHRKRAAQLFEAADKITQLVSIPDGALALSSLLNEEARHHLYLHNALIKAGKVPPPVMPMPQPTKKEKST